MIDDSETRGRGKVGLGLSGLFNCQIHPILGLFSQGGWKAGHIWVGGRAMLLGGRRSTAEGPLNVVRAGGTEILECG